MTTKAGRSPSGRDTHERSQSALSPPAVGVPNAERIAEIANLIGCASVPHECGIIGSGSRTLSYYATVGTDYLGHDHERVRALFEDAARKVLTIVDADRAMLLAELAETAESLVRLTAVARAASGMSASGQDREAGLEAKPASPVPERETPNG